jgi:hypothetical protein
MTMARNNGNRDTLTTRCLRAALIVVLILSVRCVKREQCPEQTGDVHNLCTSGVPNFELVRGTDTEAGHAVYRGGQPTEGGWEYLRSIGINTVVKLNDAQAESWGQGEDEPARRLGMKVVVTSIPPRDYGIDLRSVPQPFEKLPEDTVALAVATLASPGKVFVHCTHGRDRTGLVVGLFRYFVQQWPASDAYQEMKREGFRPINANLFIFWEKMFADADAKEATARRERLAGAILHARSLALAAEPAL